MMVPPFVGVWCRMIPYERFNAWRAAHELTLAVYRVTGSYPRSELYGLTSQTRRAAFSVAANIAEGAAKRGSVEFRRYLDIALGSLSELSYALRLARELDLLSVADAAVVEDARIRASKLTWGLYKLLSRRIATAKSGVATARPPVRQTA